MVTQYRCQMYHGEGRSEGAAGLGRSEEVRSTEGDSDCVSTCIVHVHVH